MRYLDSKMLAGRMLLGLLALLIGGGCPLNLDGASKSNPLATYGGTITVTLDSHGYPTALPLVLVGRISSTTCDSAWPGGTALATDFHADPNQALDSNHAPGAKQSLWAPGLIARFTGTSSPCVSSREWSIDAQIVESSCTPDATHIVLLASSSDRWYHGSPRFGNGDELHLSERISYDLQREGDGLRVHIESEYTGTQRHYTLNYWDALDYWSNTYDLNGQGVILDELLTPTEESPGS